MGKFIFVLFCCGIRRDEEKETQNINVVGINVPPVMKSISRQTSPFANMGAGLLSFVLSYTTKMSPPEIREASFAFRLVTKSVVFLPYKHFPDFRW